MSIGQRWQRRRRLGRTRPRSFVGFASDGQPMLTVVGVPERSERPKLPSVAVHREQVGDRR